MEKEYTFLVDNSGDRVDRYVHERCPELSRSQIQRLITDEYITVNTRIAKSSLKLDTGDRVHVVIPPVPSTTLEPEPIPLNIVYEDNDLLVVDKPPDLTVYPAPGHPCHTLINAVLSHVPTLPRDTERPGIVHRLDKDTSGLMVAAKSTQAQENLVDQFKSRQVLKAYLVLVRGHLQPERGAIEAPIGRDTSNRKRMAVVEEGKQARTLYQVMRYIGSYTLLEVRLETGRTHQIRVHLSAIGFPVVGDKVYGIKSTYLSRQFLHACRLGFHLPSTGEYVEFESKLPADLTQALEDMT